MQTEMPLVEPIIEFSGGKVTKLTTNVIAESMYAQSDADEKEYLLLDLPIDCWVAW